MMFFFAIQYENEMQHIISSFSFDFEVHYDAMIFLTGFLRLTQ